MMCSTAVPDCLSVRPPFLGDPDRLPLGDLGRLGVLGDLGDFFSLGSLAVGEDKAVPDGRVRTPKRLCPMSKNERLPAADPRPAVVRIGPKR